MRKFKHLKSGSDVACDTMRHLVDFKDAGLDYSTVDPALLFSLNSSIQVTLSARTFKELPSLIVVKCGSL